MKTTTTASKQTKAKPVKKIASVDKLAKADLILLGNRIKELRIEKGYTNYEYFAFEHNIPRSQFGRYEKGEDLRYSSLIRVIRAFGITVEDFFKGIK